MAAQHAHMPVPLPAQSQTEGIPLPCEPLLTQPSAHSAPFFSSAAPCPHSYQTTPQLDVGAVLDYKFHANSLNDGSTFRNAEQFVVAGVEDA
jgi:hypothetical protein